LREEYERFKRDTRHQRTTVLDEYGANNPAEFFAVATEHFFEKPRELQQVYPRLYQELARFYQQDPAALAGPSQEQQAAR
jgi:Mlc titration factor MtfA (ptsG expression regulator)